MEKSAKPKKPSKKLMPKTTCPPQNTNNLSADAKVTVVDEVADTNVVDEVADTDVVIDATVDAAINL
jgi:hypothetical protein